MPTGPSTTDESSEETAPGPSAMLSAGAPIESTLGPSAEQSSQPPAVPNPATAVEEGTGTPADSSLLVVGVPSPATLEIAIGSRTDTSVTVAINALASSITAESSSGLAPSLNSAQSPSSLTQLQSTLALESCSLIASAIVDAHSSTHMANPSASAAAVSSPLSPTSATTSPEDMSLCKVGWSSLPAELREEVYKELLLVDMHQEQRDLSCHHLHLDILRVDRQTYKEASDILYLRNTWVRIDMDLEVEQYIESRINNVRYWKGKLPIELCSVEFPHVAALNIVVYNREKKNLPRHTYIISSFAMPQICRALTMPPIRTEEMPPLGLKLDSATALEGAMWDRKGLLDCFVETRGLEALKYTKRVAMLAECRGKDGLAQLGAIALPLNDPAVVMERTSTYLNRGRQQVRAKHIYEALATFLEGADYVLWLTVSDIENWLEDNPYGMSYSVMANLGIDTQLVRNWWDFIEQCVLCCMQLGDMTLARNTLLPLFRGPYWQGYEETDAYHTLPLIGEALGDKNSVACSFLRALYPTPGFEATNKAID